MKLRTEINIPHNESLINYNDNILTLGSCFAENIAAKFKSYLFSVFDNPFGVLYNPASIFNSLNLLQMEWEELDFENHLVENLGEWHSFFHNSDFSYHKKEVVLDSIKQQLKITKEFLYMTDWTIITLGTGFVYKHKEKDFIVSNCHKLPANTFERYLMPLDSLSERIHNIYALLRHFNPEMKIIFTVSPVRHMKDGAVDNQRSKSSLVLAISNVLKETVGSYYFPSYELMMDDLRDYRFYKEDLVHPNGMAIDYIWKRFKNSYFDKPTIEFLADIEPLKNGAHHRVRNAESPENLKFIENHRNKLNLMQTKYPTVNFDDYDIL